MEGQRQQQTHLPLRRQLMKPPRSTLMFFAPSITASYAAMSDLRHSACAALSRLLASHSAGTSHKASCSPAAMSSDGQLDCKGTSLMLRRKVMNNYCSQLPHLPACQLCT